MYKELRKEQKITSKNSIYEALTTTVSGNMDHTTFLQYNTSTWYHYSSSYYGLQGLYSTLYDADYSLSTSYALFDMTFGIESSAANTASFIDDGEVLNKKIIVYKDFQQHLLGSTDSTFQLGTETINYAYFMAFRRNIYRDSLRPDYTKLAICTILSGGASNPSTQLYSVLTDEGASSNLYKCHCGNYGYLTDSGSTNRGLVFYEAGVVVLSASAFPNYSGDVMPDHFLSGAHQYDYVTGDYTFQNVWNGYGQDQVIKSGTIDTIISSSMQHIVSASYNNRADVYSKIYEINLGLGEYTYSSNPTFIDSSGKIETAASGTTGEAKYAETYISGVGLYDASGDLIAVAKLAYPVKKMYDSSLNILVRIDF